LVVSADGKTIDGIVSERDLAYVLATYGDRLPTDLSPKNSSKNE
jgi:hypothetical protein